VPEHAHREMMKFIRSYYDDFSITEEANDLGTIEQVKTNAFFLKLEKDLIEALKRIKDEEGSEALDPYIDNSTREYKIMIDKLACLISRHTPEYFGLSDEDMEKDVRDEVSEVQVQISEAIGELLDELELNYEAVDQIKQMYLIIDLSKVPDFKDTVY